MNLALLRFVMAAGSLLVVTALAAGILFFGDKLTQTQVALLALLAGAAIGELKAASSYIFDGVPDKPGSNADQPETAQPKDSLP